MFLGVATVALATGAHLRTPRAVAILTTGYSVGQIAAGPVLVTPLLHHSYPQALLASAAIVTVAAVAALMLRHRFPITSGPSPRGYWPPMTEGVRWNSWSTW